MFSLGALASPSRGRFSPAQIIWLLSAKADASVLSCQVSACQKDGAWEKQAS